MQAQENRLFRVPRRENEASAKENDHQRLTAIFIVGVVNDE